MFSRFNSRFNDAGQLDSAALVISALCVLHCAAGLWLVAGVASAASVMLSPWIHEAGLILAAAIAVLALGNGVLRHGTYLPLAFGSVGIIIMAIALKLHHHGEMTLTIIGVTLLAVGHILNYRAGRALT